MPDILFRVSMTAAQFMVPWGLAFIRLKEEGFIVMNSEGFFEWVNQDPDTGDAINDSD